MTGRREYDNRRFWRQPVERRDVAKAAALLALFFGGLLFYTVNLQNTIKKNQCDSLNRLAETKVVIAETLAEADLARWEDRIAKLKVGITSLERDVERLNGCEVFPAVRHRHLP